MVRYYARKVDNTHLILFRNDGIQFPRSLFHITFKIGDVEYIAHESGTCNGIHTAKVKIDRCTDWEQHIPYSPEGVPVEIILWGVDPDVVKRASKVDGGWCPFSTSFGGTIRSEKELQNMTQKDFTQRYLKVIDTWEHGNIVGSPYRKIRVRCPRCNKLLTLKVTMHDGQRWVKIPRHKVRTHKSKTPSRKRK